MVSGVFVAQHSTARIVVTKESSVRLILIFLVTIVFCACRFCMLCSSWIARYSKVLLLVWINWHKNSANVKNDLQGLCLSGFPWFKRGEESVDDKCCAGRPFTTQTKKKLKCEDIVELSGVIRISILRILLEDLAMKRVVTKVVPRVLIKNKVVWRKGVEMCSF